MLNDPTRSSRPPNTVGEAAPGPPDAAPTRRLSDAESAPQPDHEATQTPIRAVAEAFEAAWRKGTLPRIAGFLPPAGPDRTPLALALARIDMEWRARIGLVARPDDYLAEFPELAASPEAADELRRSAATLMANPKARVGGNTDEDSPGTVLQTPEEMARALALAAEKPAVIVPGYEILGRLGSGGMGVVYKARQLRLNRLVALKMVIHGDHAHSQQFIRLLGEAEAVAAVDHPHVVRVYESGQHGGRPYIAMECLEGGTLAERLISGGPMPPYAAAELLGRVARGVQAAHEASIVHRDLKPGNVLFDQSGSPKVADFGLAKRGTSCGLTRTGAIMGTPDYMAPEQATGRGKFIGPPADVWALGVVLYECLTGRRPFAAPDPVETLRRVREESPLPLTASGSSGTGVLPRDLRLICAKCLEKNPAHRYPTARELADDLERFLANEPTSARAAGPVERAVKWARRKPTKAALAAALAALLVTIAAGGVTIAVREVQTAEHIADEERAHAERLGREETRTRAALRSAVEVSTRLVVNDLAETGDAARGSVRLAHALGSVAGAGVPDLETAVRSNLALWAGRVHTLRWAFPADGRGPVQAAALSRDGTRVAAAFPDGTVVLWRASGEEIGTPLRAGSPVEAVEFTPDGRALLVRGKEAVELWDSEKAARLATVAHPGGVWAAVFSADGELLVTGGEDRVARVTRTRTGAETFAPLKHEGPVHAVAVGADNRHILTGSWDRTARLWDAAAGEAVGEGWKHAELVQAVALAPDGRFAATGTWDGKIHLWNTPTGTAAGVALTHSPDPIRGLAYSPDGRVLLSWAGLTQGAANRNDGAHLWEPRTGRHVAALPHVGPVLAAIWTPDGKVLTGGFDGTARLWDAAGRPVGSAVYHRDAVSWVGCGDRGRTLMTADTAVRLWQPAGDFPGPVLAHGSSVQVGLVSPDGRLVFTGGDRAGRLWDAATGRRFGEEIDAGRTVWAAAFFPDSQTLATGAADGTGRIWDVASGREVGVLRHGKAIRAVAVSPRGDRVATGSADRTAGLWDRDGRRIGEPLAHDGEVMTVAFSPNGRLLATGGRDGVVKLWDADTGRPQRRAFKHGAPVAAVAFTPNSETLMTAGEDGVVRVWDMESGRERTPPLRHDGAIRALAASPNGRLLATASNDRTARVWNLATGAPVGRPFTHADRVAAVAFSPDGRTVVTGSSDHTGRLWDVATGLPLGPPLRHAGGVRAVAFTPDGRSVLTVSLDQTARIWHLPPPTLDSPERAALNVSVATGLELTAGQNVRVLDAAGWHDVRRRLDSPP